MPNLNQYAAILAFAAESTEGLTMDEITDAVAHHFREYEDPTFSVCALCTLGILAPVSHYDIPGRKVRGFRMLPTSDALSKLRKLNTALRILERDRDLWRDSPDLMNANLIIATGLRLKEVTSQLEVLCVLPSHEES